MLVFKHFRDFVIGNENIFFVALLQKSLEDH